MQWFVVLPLRCLITLMMPPESLSWLERWCLARLIRAIASAIGVAPQRWDYVGFIEITRQLQRGRSPAQQQAIVATVFDRLIPPMMSTLIRKLFRPSRWVCEWNAWFATRLTGWLVGASDRYWVEVIPPNQLPQWQHSGVRIQKCRYLAESQCMALCMNLCKKPTEQFFRQRLGIPLTMTPNFKDYSCEMVFGTPAQPIPQPPLLPCWQDPSQTPCPYV
ncbi:tll1942 [Thermosynechococcus vestitus BP-1]|uniref:Tll1942 protein n=2 Tax=Thermosynechococcus vestitus TaxID=146786 RepID=Q8DHK7_THEVB|nr:tll1942 [Thermosynechococcus vestitus BP-1]BAY53048.1 hypothetical protein NIES2134_118700 [Thermostichus vulcanus NIES-2134]